jgi:hypothetical protein
MVRLETRLIYRHDNPDSEFADLNVSLFYVWFTFLAGRLQVTQRLPHTCGCGRGTVFVVVVPSDYMFFALWTIIYMSD